MIQGGWPFVAWAYGLAYGGLALYGLLLWRRIEQAHDRAAQLDDHEQDPP